MAVWPCWQGVAGIFLGASKEHERIYARNRLGYIRLAMEAGAGGAALSSVCTLASMRCLCDACMHIQGILRGPHPQHSESGER